VSSPAVPCRLPLFPIFSAFPCRPLSSPAVLCRHLPSHTRRCLTSWGSSSFVMTAVLEVQGPEWTAFCRPVRSLSKAARQVGMKDEDGPHPTIPSRPGLLAVPAPGPTRAPDGCEHCFNVFSISKLPSMPHPVRSGGMAGTVTGVPGVGPYSSQWIGNPPIVPPLLTCYL